MTEARHPPKPPAQLKLQAYPYAAEGERVRAAINELGLTLADFAAAAGVSPSHVSEVCRGKNRMLLPVLELLIGRGYSATWLLQGNEPRKSVATPRVRTEEEVLEAVICKRFWLDTKQERDGRWSAIVMELGGGCQAFGSTAAEARSAALKLGIETLFSLSRIRAGEADRIRQERFAAVLEADETFKALREVARHLANGDVYLARYRQLLHYAWRVRDLVNDKPQIG